MMIRSPLLLTSVLAALLVTACGQTETAESPCALAADDPAREAFETRCDGLDNDCDGSTDLLPGVIANGCSTGAQGACGSGASLCRDGAKICVGPPAVAEVQDGVDNDCDGTIDNVPMTPTLPAAARLMAPPYLWDESPELPVDLVGAFGQVGIPVYSATMDGGDYLVDWDEAFKDLDQRRYALVIMPGYLMPAKINAKYGQLESLEAWVKAGGVLVWFKPIGPNDKEDASSAAWQRQVLALGGLTGGFETHMEATRVVVSPTVPAALYLDSAQELDIKLSDNPDTIPVEALTYDVDPASGAQIFARAMAGNQDLGAVMIRRALGQGAVYTIGFDPLEYTEFRCYVNCFDPGRDIMSMLLRGLFREATAGHEVRKHTVPGVEKAVFVPSHDVDAPDANNPGPWGEPGALQMADMEKSQGVKGTYFITTDYVADYYDPDMVSGLCARGMCPEGGHSIQHLYWGGLAKGDCGVTKNSYDPKKPTVCGEVAVNLKILREVLGSGARLAAWRTPFLEANPMQFDVFAEQGIQYDTSLAIGDLRTSFPIDLRSFPFLRDSLFHGRDLIEFPVVLEDGIGWIENGKERRLELQGATWVRFREMWRQTLIQNGANGATTVLLVHPSFGVDAGPENVGLKVDAVKWAITYAKQLGMRVEGMTNLGDFWRGRRDTVVEAQWQPNKGYSGKIAVGPVDAPRFSLAFGDHITSFDCPGAPGATIADGIVVFDAPLSAGKTYTFKAN